MRRSAAGSRSRGPPDHIRAQQPAVRDKRRPNAWLPLRPPARAMGPDPCCSAGHADGRLRPGHGPAAGWEGAPVTRRLLVVAAVAAMLGLLATPALDETPVGGWFGLPWGGSRGLGQHGPQGEPTAPHPTTNQQGGNLSHRSPHARPHPRGHGPSSGAPRAGPTRQAAGARPACAPTARSPVTRSLAKGRATAKSSSCHGCCTPSARPRRRREPRGRPWPTLLPVRQAVGHICTRRSA